MTKFYIAILLTCFGSTRLNAHDTFLTFESYFLPPHTSVTAQLMNGTFESSENSIALERMRDVRITGPNHLLQRPTREQWRLTDKLNRLAFKTGRSGTYVVGVSIKPRTFEMTAEKFDNYLEHDGVLDILRIRRSQDIADGVVREKYSKHVKALIQVGEERTDSFGDVHDFPIEIVPQKNPFSVSVGESLPVLVLLRGEPLKNQLVYGSYAGFHKHDDDGQHIEAVQTRTNDQGIAQIKIEHSGRWYLRLIHMVPSTEQGVDYESNWATLTFEIK